MSSFLRNVLCAALIATMACAYDTPGDFGPYHSKNKQLRLTSGDTLVVYRVKYWRFEDGSAPALQIEYESPASVADTNAVIEQGIRIWPVFAQYVEAAELKRAIITATNLRRRGFAGFWRQSGEHYGLVAERDKSGDWRFEGRQGVLPPTDHPSSPKIFEASGKPMSTNVGVDNK